MHLVFQDWYPGYTEYSLVIVVHSPSTAFLMDLECTKISTRQNMNQQIPVGQTNRIY